MAVIHLGTDGQDALAVLALEDETNFIFAGAVELLIAGAMGCLMGSARGRFHDGDVLAGSVSIGGPILQNIDRISVNSSAWFSGWSSSSCLIASSVGGSRLPRYSLRGRLPSSQAHPTVRRPRQPPHSNRQFRRAPKAKRRTGRRLQRLEAGLAEAHRGRSLDPQLPYAPAGQISLSWWTPQVDRRGNDGRGRPPRLGRPSVSLASSRSGAYPFDAQPAHRLVWIGDFSMNSGRCCAPE